MCCFSWTCRVCVSVWVCARVRVSVGVSAVTRGALCRKPLWSLPTAGVTLLVLLPSHLGATPYRAFPPVDSSWLSSSMALCRKPFPLVFFTSLLCRHSGLLGEGDGFHSWLCTLVFCHSPCLAYWVFLLCLQSRLVLGTLGATSFTLALC